MTYTHVLFDLDHTLLDTDHSLELAFADAMGAAGADPTGLYNTFDEINESLWRHVEAGSLTPPQVHILRFEQLNQQLGLGADPAAMADAFALGMGTHGDLYPGALDLLDALAPAVTMALVTNGLSDIQRSRIDRLGLADYFRAIIISAEVGVAKPNPAIFDFAFDGLGNPARDQAMMVGDNLGSDIAGGNNAEIATCWYNPHARSNPGEHSATHEISSLAQLPALVLPDGV